MIKQLVLILQSAFEVLSTGSLCLEDEWAACNRRHHYRVQ